MKNDPFALLGVTSRSSKSELAKAFAQARTRGISSADARKAFDSLRDPVAAEAMTILAVSATPGYQKLMAVDEGDAPVEAAGLLTAVAAAVLDDLESHLGAEEVLPSEEIRRDVRDYVPPPLEELEP